MTADLTDSRPGPAWPAAASLPLATDAGPGALRRRARGRPDRCSSRRGWTSPALRARRRGGILPALLRGLVPAAPRRTAGGAAGAGRARANASPARRGRAAAARCSTSSAAQVAAVLGHAGAGRVDADRPSSDLGFDSLTAVELRNRLDAEPPACGCPPPSSSTTPPPSALAGHLLARAARRRRPTRPARSPRPAPPTDEPIAIVGMACRYPGGVDLARGAVGLVADGSDAIGAFPTDRGWDLDGLYDPDPDHPRHDVRPRGRIPARRRRSFDAGVLRDLAARGAGDGPAAAAAAGDLLGGARTRRHRPGRRCAAAAPACSPGVMYHDYAARLTAVPDGVEGYLGTGSAGSVASGRVAYTLRPRRPGGHRRHRLLVVAGRPAPGRAGAAQRRVHAGAGRRRHRDGHARHVRRVQPAARPGRRTAAASRSPTAPTAPAGPRASGCCCWNGCPTRGATATRCSPSSAARAVNQDGASNGLTAPNGPSQQRVIRQALADAGLTAADVDAVEAHGTGTDAGRPDRGAGAAGHLRPGAPTGGRCGSAR